MTQRLTNVIWPRLSQFQKDLFFKSVIPLLGFCVEEMFAHANTDVKKIPLYHFDKKLNTFKEFSKTCF